jgi:hypothetical protein
MEDITTSSPVLVRMVCKNEVIIEYESGTMEKRGG